MTHRMRPWWILVAALALLGLSLPLAARPARAAATTQRRSTRTTAAPTAAGDTPAPAAAGATCTLLVPADPLGAAGLATPYRLRGCHEADPDAAAFVQAAVLDPATGAVSVYAPLVVDEGTEPAAAPVRPVLPAGAVVGLWFGHNGDTLLLRDAAGGTPSGCVNGLAGDPFGQFAACNADAFFSAAADAVRAGRLQVPALGTGTDGLPCPTTRDFSVVDQDQSDNVTTTYLVLPDGRTAQNTASNRQTLAGAQAELNGSDNVLLNAFVQPALGCRPFTAPDLADPGATVTALPLNELQAGLQPAPVALVPPNDPMTLRAGRPDLTKTNAYRAAVGQPPLVALGTAAADYCRDLAAAPARIDRERTLTEAVAGPAPDTANSLFTFLAARFHDAYDRLDCRALTGTPNPANVVRDGAGVVVDATFQAPVTTTTTGTTTTPTTTTTTTTTSTGGAVCSAVLIVVARWPGGFVAVLAVRNSGRVGLRGWTATWQPAAGERYRLAWSGRLSPTGNTVRVGNAAWNGRLAPGGTALAGLVGSSRTTFRPPTVTCAAA